MLRYVRRSTISGASRRHGSRAIDDRQSRKREPPVESSKSPVLRSSATGLMRDRVVSFPRTQVYESREKRGSRCNLLAWYYYPTQPVNLRGNHPQSAASPSSDTGGWWSALELPAIDLKVTYEGAAA